MTDRGKVIKGLECCKGYEYKCNDCPYYDPDLEGRCDNESLYDDALALVKEQESILNRLRSTMEDMVRGNASQEVSYFLRLMNKWEKERR